MKSKAKVHALNQVFKETPKVCYHEQQIEPTKLSTRRRLSKAVQEIDSRLATVKQKKTKGDPSQNYHRDNLVYYAYSKKKRNKPDHGLIDRTHQRQLTEPTSVS